MIVVDSSVWIDVINNRDSGHARMFHTLLSGEVDLAYTGVVLCEVLRGVRSDTEAQRLQRVLASYPPTAPLTVADYARAAQLYRRARAAGRTLSATSDCLIASVCIRDDFQLLHADSDFDFLATISPLRVLAVAA